MVTIDYNDFTKKGLKSLLQKLETGGLTVKDVTADNKQKREAGFAVKQATVNFEDGQTLVLKVKASGDLYQARLNGKVLAIKNYHKPDTFTDEVMAYVKGNEAAYAKQKEKQLSRTKVAVPKIKPVNTTIAEQITAFTTSLEEFKGQNEAVKVQLEQLQPVVGEKQATLKTLKTQLDAENSKSADLQKQLAALNEGVMESAGEAPSQLDREQIAKEMMQGSGRHPKLKAAFVDGFSNSCDINDAILFINSFSDAELMDLLKAEENIFEGVQLVAGEHAGIITSDQFLDFIKAPEGTSILEAIGTFNGYQEQEGKPARAALLECSECGESMPSDPNPLVSMSGEVLAARDMRGTYAIRAEDTGWGVFQDTTVITPFVYQPPVTTTLGSRGDCPKCGASMEPCSDGDGCMECPSCGTKTNSEGSIMEAAKPLPNGSEVVLGGHRKLGDDLRGKKGVILESIPTAEGPFYKVKVDDLIYRGVSGRMILEGIGLEIDRSGYHDINDPDHINDPDRETYATTEICPWCGSSVEEKKCVSCGLQYDVAMGLRKQWEAYNKPLPSDDWPTQYE